MDARRDPSHDSPRDVADLLNERFPGPENKSLRAQILLMMQRHKLSWTEKITARQLDALHDAALEELSKRSGPHAHRYALRPRRRRPGYPPR